MPYPLSACHGRVVIPAGSAAPPLPSFANVVAAYGLNLFNLAILPSAALLQANSWTLADNGVAPYPGDYADFIGNADAPPYLVDVWSGQTSTNDATSTGSKRPTLQIESSVLVSGAGTSSANGVYTYRGQDGGYPYYNLAGQPDNLIVSAIRGSGSFTIYGPASEELYGASDDVPFPWQSLYFVGDGTGPAPTVAVGTQGGSIIFDGTQTGLVGSGPLYSGGSATGTLYIGFKPASLIETSVLLETGTGAADQARRISIRLVAGVLTCSVYDATAVVALANTKIKTISDTNWHLLAFTFDTGQATAANQTALKVDNSTSGVSSPVSSDVAGLLMGNAVPSFGSRNNGASAFFTGSERLNYFRSSVDDAAAQTQMYNYWVYLQSTMP